MNKAIHHFSLPFLLHTMLIVLIIHILDLGYASKMKLSNQISGNYLPFAALLYNILMMNLQFQLSFECIVSSLPTLLALGSAAPDPFMSFFCKDLRKYNGLSFYLKYILIEKYTSCIQRFLLGDFSTEYLSFGQVRSSEKLDINRQVKKMTKKSDILYG